jgi:hypothetical protein
MQGVETRHVEPTSVLHIQSLADVCGEDPVRGQKKYDFTKVRFKYQISHVHEGNERISKQSR